MAANAFSLKSVGSGAQAEIAARENVQALNIWFASRTNWVKVESYCSGCSSDVSPLYGMKYPSSPYEGGWTGRPKPIVDSVQVKQQGNLGSTRQATIKFIAFTDDQMTAINNCYCVPAMSVRVQFGWNRGAVEGSSPPSTVDGAMTDNEAICAINTKRESSGVYDGLQGKVASFSTSFNKDLMAWEITINIIAASAAVLARPLQDHSTMCYCDQETQNEQGDTVKENVGMSAFKAKVVAAINAAASWTESIPTGFLGITLNHATRDATGNANATIGEMVYKTVTFGQGTNTTTEAFMTLGTIEEMVNDLSQSQTGGQPLMQKHDSSHFGKISYKAPGVSSDPDICLFPGLDSTDYKGLTGTCVDGDGIDVKAILMNCIFVNKCIEDIGKDGSIGDFFSKLFQGLNQASGGLFELDIVDVAACGSKTPVLSIIDLQKAGVVGATMINVSPTAAVVRDVKLDMKLPDAMMSQALYGGNRKNTTANPCDEHRYKTILGAGVNNNADPSDISPPKADCPTDCKTEEEHGDLTSDYADLVKDVTDTHKESVRGGLVKAYNAGAATDICKNSIMPFEMSLTFDGIGGFGWGQAITCNLLPSYVKERFVYQITSVEHSVTYGDWTTTVNAKGRYK